MGFLGTAPDPNYNDPAYQGALTNQATNNISDLLNKIRARGATREAETFQAGASAAEDRGIALGSGGSSFGKEFGGISGLAANAVAPGVFDVRAETESDVTDAIQRERDRIANLYLQQRQEDKQEESGKEQSLMGLGGSLLGLIL